MISSSSPSLSEPPQESSGPAGISTSSGQRHLFIVGFYRSGTSLLYCLLNLHPEIKLVYEADILGNPLFGPSSWTRKNWWESLDFFNGCIQRHRLTPAPSWKSARSNRQRADVVYRHHAGTEPLYVGEKCPAYYNRLPHLACLYPDARFLTIWRHPKGVTSSIFKAGQGNSFFKKRSLYIRSVVGLERMQEDAMALRRQGRLVFDFCYEDLVDDPESTLRSICAFLKIPFDPAMLEFKNVDSSMLPPGEHHAKVTSGAINPTVHVPEPALEAIHAKIQRYLVRWRKRFPDQLASRRYWSECDGNSPNRGEVLGDRLSYFGGRLISELLTPLLFGLTPRAWLERYRYRRTQRNSDL